MKELFLKEITLSNWKGQNRKVVFKDRYTTIMAENGAGKTSLYNALVWLFTSYTDALNSKNHELYDNTKEIDSNTPEASVTAIVTIDGLEYTIEKRAKASFSLNKETGIYEKDSSDKYTVYLDNIETSATNYNKWLTANVGDTDILLYALLGERFANLAIDDKKKARKVLEIVSGQVRDSDLHGDYSLIADDIKKYSVEQLKERYRNQLKPLKARVDAIEEELKSINSEIAEYGQINYEALTKIIDIKTKEIQDIDKQILGTVDTIEPVQKKRNEILACANKLRIDLNDKKMQYEQAQRVRLNELKRKLNDIDEINRSIENKNNANKKEYDHQCRLLDLEKNNLDILKQTRKNLLKQRDEIKARVFTAEKCAYCGQDLPIEEVDRLQTAFNKRKQSDLDIVIKNGKEVKASIEISEKRIDELNTFVSLGYTTQPFIEKDDIEAEYEKERSSIIKYEDTEEYRSISTEISDIMKSLPELPVIDNTELTSKKSVLLDEIKELSRQFGKKDIIEKRKQEIIVIENERKLVCSEIALMQGVLSKLMEYEKEKALVISDRVNKKLTGCKVVMYSRQKNGDLIPDCVIVDDKGIKYTTINNSNRIKMCLALQIMFAEHMGIKLPVFVDEASIFTEKNTPKFDRQTIYLYAENVNEMIIS